MDNSAIDTLAATAGFVGGPESADTQAEIELAISELRLEPGLRVLDLPCGNGRHAWWLGQRGLRVTAVDVSADSLEVARRDCAHPNVQYHPLDARRVGELGTTFDAALSLFSYIGYLEDEAQDEAALRAMLSTLVPGGRFLLSTANGTVVARAGNTRARFESGSLRIERIDTYDEQRRCLERQYEVLDMHSGERSTLHHRRRLYSPDELTALLARCGATGVYCLGDYAGAPFLPDHSPHAIYVGTREG